MANTNNISIGKPYVDGAIYKAPKGTPLPTTADETLDSAFESLGFVSDAGVTNTTEAESSDLKAWGGKEVMSNQTSKSDKYQFTLLEVLNVIVLKTVYGDDNVTVDENGNITVRANASDAVENSWVIDTLLHGRRKRIVMPNAKVSAVGDLVYNNTDPLGYETTLSCFPYDEQNFGGDTHREYIQGEQTPTPSADANITSFVIGDAQGVINEEEITVTVSSGTDVTNLTPSIAISTGATIEPASGVAQDFTNPVEYVVTSQDGSTTKTYTVTVVAE